MDDPNKRWHIQNDPRWKVDREELWAAMDEADTLYAEVDYCGGNDSGEIDGIRCYTQALDKMSRNTDIRIGMDDKEPVFLDRRSVFEPTGDLYKLLERLPSEKYLSFAGEFSCSGTVTVNRPAKMIIMDGSESGPDVPIFEVL